MKIEVSNREAVARARIVPQVLKPLVERPSELFVIPKQTTREELVITVREKKFNAVGGYADLRFKTVVPNFWAMYYEVWKKTYQGRNEFYYLYRAYLHLYWLQPSTGEEFEFLLLHCDPNEPDSAAHAKYKQSLHLHIECTDAPYPHGDVWPHAHIALNVGYLNSVLKDATSLTEAMRVAVLMLREQVLQQLL